MDVAQRLYSSLQLSIGSSLGELFWYGLLASTTWFAFYVLFRTHLRHRRVSPRDPSAGQIRREALHSLRSIAIFGAVTGVVLFAALSGGTRLYHRVDDHGWAWLIASVGLMVLMHDAYFYWTHRLMHHPWVYRRVHRTHHLSVSPTPWAAYAFSPAEAVVQAGIGPLIVFTVPTHALAFAAFMLWQIVFNVLGHCGYEIFPRWFMRTPLGWLLNSVTHHAQHHEKFRANYGLYFNVWDRLMGTNHADYEAKFDRATSGHLAPVTTSRLASLPQADRPPDGRDHRDLPGEVDADQRTGGRHVPPPPHRPRLGV